MSLIAAVAWTAASTNMGVQTDAIGSTNAEGNGAMTQVQTTIKPGLSDSELAALTKLDTPTICNALEVLSPERRSSGFTTRPLVCAFPDLPSTVGYARTATIRALHPSASSKQEDRQLRLGYYEYIAGGPSPRICVIQDLDGEQAGFGAFWGEVQTNLHKALGCVGGITDGSIRDIPMMAPGFQMLAGSLGPSHAHVHLVDFGSQVKVAGMVVRSGDLVHADRHGAVVIPHELATRVAAAADLCARREAVVLEACRRPGFTIANLREALSRMDEIH